MQNAQRRKESTLGEQKRKYGQISMTTNWNWLLSAIGETNQANEQQSDEKSSSDQEIIIQAKENQQMQYEKSASENEEIEENATKDEIPNSKVMQENLTKKDLAKTKETTGQQENVILISDSEAPG